MNLHPHRTRVLVSRTTPRDQHRTAVWLSPYHPPGSHWASPWDCPARRCCSSWWRHPAATTARWDRWRSCLLYPVKNYRNWIRDPQLFLRKEVLAFYNTWPDLVGWRIRFASSVPPLCSDLVLRSFSFSQLLREVTQWTPKCGWHNEQKTTTTTPGHLALQKCRRISESKLWLKKKKSRKKIIYSFFFFYI